MCSQYSWVFDFKVDHTNQGSVTVNADKVYKCKEIIAQKVSDKLDFAVIRLDRRVGDREPVKLAKEIKLGAPVVMIGHPSGLPQKIADKAFIKSISATEFKATVDAFQINSGSAVFHAQNGELLGILVRGKKDYRTNQQYKCTEPNVTSEDELGEDIASYTQFLSYL
jgi:V8-like Glu-specific endopeptidase